MQTNDHKIRNYDLVLDERYGAEGTPQRMTAEEEAMEYYGVKVEKKTRTVAIPTSLYLLISKKANEQGVSIRSFARQALASALL